MTTPFGNKNTIPGNSKNSESFYARYGSGKNHLNERGKYLIGRKKVGKK